MFLKRMSSSGPSRSSTGPETQPGPSSTTNKRNSGIAFTNPFGNNDMLYSPPRSLDDVPRTVNLSSSVPDGSFSGSRTDSSNSDAGSTTYDAEASIHHSKLFDIEPFRDPVLYKLAHPRPEAQHLKRSSVHITDAEIYKNRARSSISSQFTYYKSNIRERSPGPKAFQPRVAFGILDAADTAKHNTIGIVLRHQHGGFKPEKLSRTFLVGLDDQVYSHDALKWLLDCMVDDGDSVVCFRVHDKEVKPAHDKQYVQEAKKVMEMIQRENKKNKAIQITLEYAFGKLQTIFRKLISVHQPGMVIVGTKGKNNQGLQAVWTSRNSFSKYCLQYSPVPVVVVRPKNKRTKKKDKRSVDPGRHDYHRIMLEGNNGTHELDMNLDEMEKQMQNMYTEDEEAHHVARAIGLPASFDPLIKGIDPRIVGGRASAANSRPTSRPASPSGLGRNGATNGLAAKVTQSLERNGTAPRRLTPQTPASILNSAPGSDDESDVSDLEQSSKNKASLEARKEARQTKKRLHQMEVAEAQYLSKVWDEDEDEESDESVGKKKKKKKGAKK